MSAITMTSMLSTLRLAHPRRLDGLKGFYLDASSRAHRHHSHFTASLPIQKHGVQTKKRTKRTDPRFCSSASEISSSGFEELSVKELSSMLQSPKEVSDTQFVDVREPSEVRTASLPLFKNFPLGNIVTGGETGLDPTKDTVLLCHHGIRSITAARYLLQCGFDRVFNVTGGIDQYSKHVDPSVPQY